MNTTIDFSQNDRESSSLEIVSSHVTSTDTEGASAGELLQRAMNLGAYLRNIGAFMLILSALAFMLQRWGVTDHITRYFSFLGFTGVMTVAALVCGLGVKEGKSARTLFGLTAAIVPVHFAQLGALLYSVYGDVPQGIRYPSYLLWQAHDGIAVAGTIGAALLCLIPTLYLAYSTLDRGVGRMLTASALALNAVLLVPVRDPNIVAFMSAMTLTASLFLTSRIRGYSSFATKEATFARITLLLPLVVLVGRQVFLYAVSLEFVAVFLLMLAGGMYFAAPRYLSERLAEFVQSMSAAPLSLGWFLALSSIYENVGSYEDWEFLLSFGLPVAPILFGMGVFSKGTGRVLQVFSALVGLVSTLVAFGFEPSVLTSGASIFMVVGFLTVAFILQSRFILYLSTLAGVLLTSRHVLLVIESIDFNLWITLGIAGVVTIVASSLIERNMTAIVRWLRATRADIVSWNA
jgi:hypothetical protein